jgi:phosphoglycolate phosphatase
MIYTHAFCDFDGTLVDSSDGILRSLQKCIERAGLAVLVEPSRALIGPPLRSMIATVVGPDLESIAIIESAFRSEYDGHGYLLTNPYPGMGDALQTLRARGVSLHIVSNKRLIAVRQILDTLGWNGYFASVWTLDSTAGAASKSDVLAKLLAQLAVPLDSAIMVGDTLDDRLAAEASGMAFAWASWGYGQDPSLRAAGPPLIDAADFVRRVLNDGGEST